MMAPGSARLLCTMKIFLLFLQVSYVFGAEYVPVLIWETHRSSARDVAHFSPLTKVSSDDFSDYITKKVAGKTGSKSVIAAFVEENLSVEDFSSQNGEERNTFPHLENLTSAVSHSEFLPSVHAPLKGLKRLGYRWQNYQTEDENDVSSSDDGGVVIIIKLGDAKIDESRPDFLKRHDQIIYEKFNELLTKHENVIGLYTSRHSSWIEPDDDNVERRRRSLLASDGDSDKFPNQTVWKTENALIYFGSAILIWEEEERSFNNVICTQNLGRRKSDTDSAMTLTIRCKNNNPSVIVVFKFVMEASGYWNAAVVLSDTAQKKDDIPLEPSVDLYAPEGFSYHCTQFVNFTSPNGTSALKFEKLQIQPFFDTNTTTSTNTGKLVFGDAYDCVWFFTVPIWAGLAVTALLGLILMWGLIMIMDIKTMDQFDDPKGKPLTINVSE